MQDITPEGICLRLLCQSGFWGSKACFEMDSGAAEGTSCDKNNKDKVKNIYFYHFFVSHDH